MLVPMIRSGRMPALSSARRTPTRPSTTRSARACPTTRPCTATRAVSATEVMTVVSRMLKSTGNDPSHFCHACFTGQYKVGFEQPDASQLKLFDS